MKFFISLLFFILLLESVSCLRVRRISRIFNVKKYGAQANGQIDDSKAFMEAWKAACRSSGTVNLLIPRGIYLVGPIQFKGPCRNVNSIIVQIQGTLKATTDLSKYKRADWVEFGWVNGLVLTGGIFDGRGAISWPFNECPKQKNCKVLPTNIMFVNTTNTIVEGITSVNSKFFHIGLLGCTNFKGSSITIRAPANSPNTDGIHLERNRGVSITRSTIATGDDCVSIGQGNSDVTLTRIKCGPGHGISVGSLGKYKGEGDVTGLTVKDCSVTGTTNGVRIKTWENSPSASVAANMTFENIIMSDVVKPILIDQEYCPYAKCDSNSPSRVKISDIKFKNIRGTTKDPEAVTLRCSKGIPCKDITLQDISLKHVGGVRGTVSSLSSTCLNVRPTFSGTLNPPPCR